MVGRWGGVLGAVGRMVARSLGACLRPVKQTTGKCVAASQVCLVFLVYLVSFVQPSTRDRPNRPDRPNRLNGQDRPADHLEFCYGIGEALRREVGGTVEGDVTVTCSWSMCRVNGCPTFTCGTPIFELSITRPTGVRIKTKLDFSLDTVPERRSCTSAPAGGIWLICRSNCRSCTPLMVSVSSTSTVSGSPS